MKYPGILTSLVIILSCSCSVQEDSKYTVMQGEFISSFTETGELAAIRAVGLMVPEVHYSYGYEFKIIEIPDEGTRVSAGDTVIKLDDSSIRRQIIIYEEELEKQKAAANMMSVECANSIQDLEAQLRSESARYELKKLELERAEFEPLQKRKITELEFQQATIRMKVLQKKLRLKPAMNAYDQKIQQTKIRQKEADLAAAKAALEMLSIVTPASGLFQSGTSMFSGGRMLKVGDAAHSGMMIARIPDLSAMKVITWINEVDIAGIQNGTPVIVRMDALHSVPFRGYVSYLHRISIKRDQDQVFKAEVMIEDSDARLKPGMTVSCEFITYQGKKDLYVPNNCLLYEGSATWLLVKKGKKVARVPVTVLESNSRFTRVEGKIHPGQSIQPVDQFIHP